MSPDLRLRLHATQAQPCFPAASNALALPGGNGIFTATPTERITHYTLLRKVVCQMGALPPLETPTRKGGTLPLHGAHTAFSCYPALRLYRLSKSPRGIDVVSLTLGNSKLPAGNGLEGDSQNFRKFLLRNVFFSAQAFQSLTELKFHGSVCSFSFEAALLSGLIIAKGKTVGNITVGECFSTIKRTDTKLLVCAAIGAERGGSALPHRLGCGFNPPLMRITKKHPLDAFCDWCGR